MINVKQMKFTKLQEMMQSENIQALILSPSAEMNYMTGFGGEADDRPFFLGVLQEGEPFFVVHRIYEFEVCELKLGSVYLWDKEEEAFELLAEKIKKGYLDIRRVAVNNGMHADILQKIQKCLRISEFYMAAPFFTELMVCKDREELKYLRTACSLAEEAIAAVFSKGDELLRLSEQKIWAILQYEMTSRGLKNCFAGVSVGKNSALPHHIPGTDDVQRGKNLLIDFVGTYHGYYSDMTRVCYFGKPNEEYIYVYECVKEAYEAAFREVEVGKEIGKIDEAAREVIEKAGYGKFFIHGTGHGIGMSCHEAPSVKKGEKTVIKPGMVFSIEPGIYLPGKFGIRLENEIAVSEFGVEAFHTYPMDLLFVE